MMNLLINVLRQCYWWRQRSCLNLQNRGRSVCQGLFSHYLTSAHVAFLQALVSPISICNSINTASLFNALELDRHLPCIVLSNKLTELPHGRIESQRVCVSVEKVAKGGSGGRQLSVVNIAINCFDNVCDHLGLSGFAKGSTAAQVLIQPHFHHSLLVYSDHCLLNWKAAHPVGELRVSLEGGIEQMQIVWERNVFDVLEADGDAFDEQRVPAGSGAKMIFGIGLEVVRGDQKRTASAKLKGLPLIPELVLIICQQLVLLDVLVGRTVAFPHLEIDEFLPLLPLCLSEVVIVDLAA